MSSADDAWPHYVSQTGVKMSHLFAGKGHPSPTQAIFSSYCSSMRLTACKFLLTLLQESRRKKLRVMSSCLCKNSAGAFSPLLIKLVEDRKDDAIHAVNIDKTHHRTRPVTNFNKTWLNHIGRPGIPPACEPAYCQMNLANQGRDLLHLLRRKKGGGDLTSPFLD